MVRIGGVDQDSGAAKTLVIFYPCAIYCTLLLQISDT
jgi:hypothetical protein